MANYRDNKSLTEKGLGAKFKTGSVGQKDMLGGWSKVASQHKAIERQKFRNNMLEAERVALNGMADKLKNKQSNNSVSYNVVNPVGAYYNGTNSAASAVNNNPSAQLNNSAKNLSDSNISGTIWEELAEKNNALNMQMNRENNQFNAQQAQLQRNWEAQMSNTAHQREVADLKAAGLNPILSAGGTGSTTPSGSNASASNWTGADNSFVNALASLAAASIASNATITASSLNSAAVERAAAMNSSATMYASDNSARAAQYSADAAAAASMYGSDRSYKGSIYGSNTMSGAYKYGAQLNLVGSIVNGILGAAGHALPLIL